MLTIKKINTPAGFEDLRSSWAHVLAQSDNDGIFLTWEWMKTWWDVFGAGRELLILLGYDGEKLVGIAPLMRTKTRICGISLRSVEFIGSGYDSMPDHLSFITLPCQSSEFIGQVFDHLRTEGGWDVIRLRDIREDAIICMDLERVLPLGTLSTIIKRPDDICPYIILPKTWDAFQKGLSAEFRYSVKRKERNLAKKHSVVFEVVEDTEKLTQYMAVLEKIHRQRMHEKKESGTSLRSQFWEFHRRIADIFLKKGWLYLAVLRVDNKIVGSQYSFQYQQKMLYYQSGIDPEYRSFGIGVLVIAYMIRHSIEKELIEYDFLRGNESYKFHWTSTFRQMADVIIWGITVQSMVVRLLHMLKSSLLRLRPK